MVILFFIVLICLLFVYVGYPFVLSLMSLFRKKMMYKSAYLPSVSLVIPVFNEGTIIERKLKNSIALDYPNGKLRIIVASDGSTDNTIVIAGKYQRAGIRLYDLPRAGKLGTINRVMSDIKSEIVVLTDVSAVLSNDALLKMVRHFADKSVGVVTGVEKISKRSDFISTSEHAYWIYEIRIKELESKVYSTVGANGPIYAIRRDLFPSLPSHLNMCDDMAISLSVIKKGKRIVLEPSAIALEDPSLNIKDEWRRKKRISTRAWQALFYHKRLLVPFLSPIALPLIFHKLLRWLTLPFLALLLVSNLFIQSALGRVFLVIQIFLHILSVAGVVLMWRDVKLPAPVAALGYFLLTNTAQMIGLLNSLFSKGRPSWQPIERSNKM